MNAVNPTVVNTAMGKLGWSDPKKAGPMLDRIPLNQFAGEAIDIPVGASNNIILFKHTELYVIWHIL